MHTSRRLRCRCCWTERGSSERQEARREETKRRIKFFKRKHKNKINAKNKLKYVTILMFSTAATGITHHQHRRHVCTVYVTQQHAKTRLNNYYGYIQSNIQQQQTTKQKKCLSLSFLYICCFIFLLQISFWGDVCGLCVIDWSIQITIFIVTFLTIYAILAITNNYA